MKIDGTLLPWKDPRAFQREILDRRIRFHQSVKPGDLAFCDRGIPDQLAFAQYKGFGSPPALLKAVEQYVYAPVVFVAPPWPEIYTVDSVRTESFDEACAIHQFVCDVYAGLGYELAEIPRGSVQERVQFILNHKNVKT